MPYEEIDRSQIRVLPLGERKNFIKFKEAAANAEDAVVADEKVKEKFEVLAQRILVARAKGASVMPTYGAHLIKNGKGGQGICTGNYGGELIQDLTIPAPEEWPFVYFEIEDAAGRRAWTNNLFVHSRL